MIIERLPTADEYRKLLHAVGWDKIVPPDTEEKALAAARFGVVAVENDIAVGTGLVIGDGATFSYLKDIMVQPEWQGRNIGSQIIDRLMTMIRKTAPSGMLVTLFTSPERARIYEQFGFRGPESLLYGMSLRIK